jgi:maleylpyruvate isomerase
MSDGLTFFDYWRSGAGYRTRIALALKGLAPERVAVNLLAGEQAGEAHLSRSPQGFVPALKTGEAILTQSPAILEWLEETYPDPPLLPADAIGRAKVRAMAAVICCDIHPLNNLRVLRTLRDAYGQDDEGVIAWAQRWIAPGFAALERLVAESPGAGAWCWGDGPSLADCCLVPQIYAAVTRYGVDMTAYPRLARIDATAALHPAFEAAHPMNQSDRA